MFKTKINLDEFEGTSKRLLDKVQQLETDVSGKISQQIVEHLADLLVQEARKRAPVLDGNVESAIHGSTYSYGGRTMARVSFHSDELPRDYGWFVHEGIYNLGTKSIEKQNSVGVMVGRKFIERALKEEQGRYERYIKNKLWRYFKHGH